MIRPREIQTAVDEQPSHGMQTETTSFPLQDLLPPHQLYWLASLLVCQTGSSQTTSTSTLHISMICTRSIRKWTGTRLPSSDSPAATARIHTSKRRWQHLEKSWGRAMDPTRTNTALSIRPQ